jgi:hypothetical protein
MADGDGARIVGIMFGVGITAVLVHRALASRARESPRESQPEGPHVLSPGAARWRPIVHELIASTYPRINEAFAMKWGDAESAWNPCSVGAPGSLGPDGNPTEVGVGQLFNPDDFNRFGIQAADYRAYCQPAAPLAAQYRAAVAAKDSAAARAAARQMQSLTRPLTLQEMVDQVHWTLLAKIDEGMKVADAAVQKYGLQWPFRDYWKLVKAPHAYPPILNTGMPAVVKKLGRAPTDWAEFRRVLDMDMPNAEKLAAAGDPKAKLHWAWMRGLNGSEKLGNAAVAG